MLELWNTPRIGDATGYDPAEIRALAGCRNAADALFPGPVATVGEHHGWLPDQARLIKRWSDGQTLTDPPPALVVYLSTADIAALLDMAIKTVQAAVWRARNTDRPNPIPEPDVRILRRNGDPEAEGWLSGRRAELKRWRAAPLAWDEPPGVAAVMVGMGYIARAMHVQPRTVRDWYAAFSDAPVDPFPAPDVVVDGCENMVKSQPGWRPGRVAAIKAWRARYRARAKAATAPVQGESDPVVVWHGQGRSLREIAALSGLSVRGVQLRIQHAHAGPVGSGPTAR